MTYLSAAGDDATFRTTYSEATQVLSAIALTASFVAAIAGRHVIWVWTGDTHLAERVAPVFSLYALGNGLLAVAAMSYYLQVARGDLRLHIRGSSIFAVLLVPLIALATNRGGMVGAGLAWCAANLTFFLGWCAIVHRRFLPGAHWRWLVRDALLPGLIGLAPALGVPFVPWKTLSRVPTALVLGSVGCAALFSASLGTRPGRRMLRKLVLAASAREGRRASDSVQD
jgi:O-antigen/teichoic acid export membrane protein